MMGVFLRCPCLTAFPSVPLGDLIFVQVCRLCSCQLVGNNAEAFERALNGYLEGLACRAACSMTASSLNMLLELIESMVAASRRSLTEKALEGIATILSRIGVAERPSFSLRAASVLVAIGHAAADDRFWSWLEAQTLTESQLQQVLALRQGDEAVLVAGFQRLLRLCQAMPEPAHAGALRAVLQVMCVSSARLGSQPRHFVSPSLASNVVALLHGTVLPRRLQRYVQAAPGDGEDAQVMILAMRLAGLLLEATPTVSGVEAEAIKLVVLLLAHFNQFTRRSQLITIEVLNYLNQCLWIQLNSTQEDPTQLTRFR